jgi:hypothetical protein
MPGAEWVTDERRLTSVIHCNDICFGGLDAERIATEYGAGCGEPQHGPRGLSPERGQESKLNLGERTWVGKADGHPVAHPTHFA